MINAAAASDVAVLSSAVRATPPHPTLLDALEAAAQTRAPFATFHLSGEPAALGFAELLDGARRWGALLAARGVRRGDRVAILMPTGPQFVMALFGAMFIAAIPVPLAGPMTFGGMDRYLDNLGAIVANADAHVLVTYPRVRDAVRASASFAATLKDVVTELDVEATSARASAASISGDDPALIQYTSGTTGRPKGVVLSHRALVSNAFAIARGLRIDARDVGVSWLPLFHDMGLIGVLLTAICNPYAIHLISPESFAMRPARWMELVARVGGTLTAAPNFAFDLTTSRAPSEGLDLSSLRVALSGAEPVYADTVARFVEHFAPDGLRRDAVLPVYGMAESTLAVTFASLERRLEARDVDREALERRGRIELPRSASVRSVVSVGHPVAGARVAVRDAHGVTLREREVGTIHVAGPSVMDGYFRNDAASSDVLRGSWLRTGDLGFVSAGRLYVTGRSSDVIVQGGRNLYPHDIERAASDVAGTRRGALAACGVPNAARGTEDVVLVLESLERDTVSRERIARTVRGEVLAVLGVRIANVVVVPVGALPRTTSGKIRRRECARLVREGERS